jgi:hypothetical protein
MFVCSFRADHLFFFKMQVAKSLHGLHEMLRACALVAVAASAAAFSAPQVSCERVVLGGRARRPACPRPPTPRVLQLVQQNLPSAAGWERGDRRRARPDRLLAARLYPSFAPGSAPFWIPRCSAPVRRAECRPPGRRPTPRRGRASRCGEIRAPAACGAERPGPRAPVLGDVRRSRAARGGYIQHAWLRMYTHVFVFAPAKASPRARETLVTRARVVVGRLGCGTLQDDLATMFQSAGTLTFDLNVSDNENLAIAGSKVQKVCAPGVARRRTMISTKEHNCRVD